MNRKEQIKASDRLPALYVEHCRIEKENGALITKGEDIQEEQIPYGRYGILMAGPGTSITQGAVSLLGQSGTALAWCSQNGSHIYQVGQPLCASTRLLRKQARICSNEKLCLQAAKRLFRIRYPTVQSEGMTLRQLLSLEGRTVRETYRSLSEKYQIPWSGRNYDHRSYSGNAPIQRAITTENQYLYNCVYAVVTSLGLSPGLGIIHKTTYRAFVFDIADLYKEKITIPHAFKTIKETGTCDEKKIYEELREIFTRQNLQEQIVKDIKYVLMETTAVNQS